MTKPAASPLLMAAMELPATGADVPDWVHLAPTGTIQTFDGRGPYTIDNPAAVIAASFEKRGDIEVDVNHASFLAAPQGGDAPARGWIKEMQAREDGIWGRVEWTKEGRELVATQTYRRISPVFDVVDDGTGRVTAILNASLVNRNNLRGLAALNQEGRPMDFMAKLAAALGLEEGADEDVILEAITALGGKAPTETPELQAEMAAIGKALGCDDAATSAVILTAAKAAAAKDGGEATIAAMQAEMNGMAEKINSLEEGGKRGRAEAFVDGAILDKRVGVAPQRERYIAMHMRDPAEAEAIVGALPKLGDTPTTLQPPSPQEGQMALNAEQLGVARLLGIDPNTYKATLDAERAAEEARS